MAVQKPFGFFSCISYIFIFNVYQELILRPKIFERKKHATKSSEVQKLDIKVTQ